MKRWIVPALPFAFSLSLSLATAGDHASWQDSGLYLTAVKELGVLYPPGFGLYLLLCKLWTLLLFFLDFTLAVHLFSSLCAALAAGTLAVAVRDLLRSRGPLFGVLEQDPGELAGISGVVAGALLACGYTFWTAAIYAKGYALYYLLLTLLIWRMIRADESGRPRDFTLVAVLIGLAWQAHPSAALIGAALAGFTAFHARSLGARGVAARIVLAAVSALGPSVLILPILLARDPWLKMGHPATPGQFFAYVTGQRFVGMNGAFGYDGARAASFGLFLWEELLGVGLILATLGLVTIATRNRKLLLGILLWLVPYALVTILFKPEGQHDHWFLASWLPLFLALGVGACRIGLAAGARGSAVVAAAGLLGALWATGANYSSVSQRGYDLAELYGRTLLGPIDPDAVLVLYGDDANALSAYLQRVRRERPDVTLVTASFLCYRATGGTDWYDDALVRRHPFLVRPDYDATGRKFPEADLADVATAAFLNANAGGGRPVFTDRAVAPSMLRPDLMLLPAGALWKAVPRAASPPLDPRYWAFPIEPEQVRLRVRRERGQSVQRTAREVQVKPASYEQRLIGLLLQARLNLARALAERQQYAAALKLFESVAALDAESGKAPMVVYFSGLSHHALGQDERAVPLLERSAQGAGRPEWRATALFTLGQIARKKGDEESARKFFRDALAVPGLGDAFRAELEKLLR
jgi:tetratricopeptide (TPR) repeat protein